MGLAGWMDWMPEVWTFELRVPSQVLLPVTHTFFLPRFSLLEFARSVGVAHLAGGPRHRTREGGKREEGRGKRNTHTHAHTIDGRTGRTETPPSTVWRGHFFLFPLDLGILSSLSLTLGPSAPSLRRSSGRLQ